MRNGDAAKDSNGLVEAELQEGVGSKKSYQQDTAIFLRRMEGVKQLEGDKFLFTMDVVAFYPSKPREKTKESMRENLERRKRKEMPTDHLIDLREMVLRDNEFVFQGK